MEEAMEINGVTLTRESVREYLKSKRVVLWMDWMITEPGQMDKAIDWFMSEVTGCAAAAI